MANTKVVIDLEVTDKGLVATFNKTTKALVTLNAAQKEKLNLQKKLKTAGTKYLASQEEESKQIVRINKETAENNRIAGISVKRKLDNRKAMEQAAYWASKEGIEYKKNILLMREAAKQAELTAIRQIQSSKKTVSEGVSNSAMGLDQMKTTAGLSGAIVTEMGRTISDAPYGLKGMGNNISQLSSLFGMFAVNVKKSGRTMTQGFKQLGASLMGPIGIVTGLQLIVALIQSGAFDKLADWFSNISPRIKLLGEVFKDAAQQAGDLIGTFEIYARTLTDSTSTVEEKEAALKKLNEEYPDFNASILLDKDNTEAADKARKEYIKTLRAQAISQAAMTKFQEAQGKIVDLQLKQELEAQKLGFKDMDELNKKAASEEERTANIKSGRKRSQEKQLLIRLRKIQDLNKEEIQEEKKKQDILESLVTVKSGKPKGDPKEPEVFKAKQLELAKLREQFSQEAKKNDLLTDREKIKREGDFAKAELEIRRKSFVDKEKARLKAFQKGKDLSQEQIDTIESQAKAETELVIAEIDKRTAAEMAAIDAIEGRRAEAAYEGWQKQSLINDEQGDAQNAQRQAQFFNGAVTEQIMQAELDEVNYENKKKQLGRALLATEEDSAERLKIQGELVRLDKDRDNQKADNDEKVQDAKLKLANRGAAVLADILGKETKAGKAVAATMATINTYQAVSNALTKGVAPFKYIDAGITAAQGFMQVKNILNTNGPKTSGGGTSAAAVQPPDFNIIGSTGTNQLAEAIGSTTQEPIKAYVVSSEVTSAQELDRNIEESASI
jgi:hypothetical protein